MNYCHQISLLIGYCFFPFKSVENYSLLLSLPILGLAALQEPSASHDGRFPNAIQSQDRGLACLPVPCHLAEVRGCHLLLLWWGRFSTHLPFQCSEHLLFVQAHTLLSFDVKAHASRTKPLREVQFYLESRSSHLGKL